MIMRQRIAIFMWLGALVVGDVRAQDHAPPGVPAPAPLVDQFFDSKGVQIRYVEQGHGPPVVLVHGYTGYLERHFIASGVLAELAKDHRVIAFDCRGHGKSGKPSDPAMYGDEMAQDVIRLLDHLGIRRAHVVGYSMGAIIAGRLVATNPDRLLTVTFVGHHPVWQWTAADDAEAEANARELESKSPFRSLILALAPSDRPPPSEEEILKASQPLIAANDLKSLAAYHRGRHVLVVTRARLAESHVPMLEIIGSDDPSIGAARELKSTFPNIKVVVVDGATHGGERGVMRQPEFRAALQAHLTNQQ